jgi:hypothetical protein
MYTNFLMLATLLVWYIPVNSHILWGRPILCLKGGYRLWTWGSKLKVDWFLCGFALISSCITPEVRPGQQLNSSQLDGQFCLSRKKNRDDSGSKYKCEKLEGQLLQKVSKIMACQMSATPSASGYPYVSCKLGKYEPEAFLVFTSKSNCLRELNIQRAKGGIEFKVATIETLRGRYFYDHVNSTRKCAQLSTNQLNEFANRYLCYSFTDMAELGRDEVHCTIDDYAEERVEYRIFSSEEECEGEEHLDSGIE